jgi:type IV pilus assembly protein PilN
MRVNINLASQKYEDVRQFYVRWGAALAVLAVLSVLLGTLSYLKYSHSKASARRATDVQHKIVELQKQRDQLAAFENRPENRDVTQQKKFWNSQIARRSFSWTQLLNDMQRIMPRRAFLDSVQPELTLDNRFKLRLTITGEKREDARELLVRMEDSPRFHSPRPVSDNLQKDPKPGMLPTYKWEIETFYTPTGPAPSPPPAKNQRGEAKPAHPGAKEGV